MVNSSDKHSIKINPLAAAALTAIVVVLVGALFVLDRNYTTLKKQDRTDYLALWKSRLPDRMQKVIKSAVIRGSKPAMDVIVKEALEGDIPDFMRQSFVKLALHPLWVNRLSTEDIKKVIALSLKEPDPALFKALGDLRESYAGVLLAIVAEVPISQSVPEDIRDLPLSKFFELPSYYGEVYRNIAKTGVARIGDPPSHALAHIFAGKITGEAMNLYLGEYPIARLKALSNYFYVVDDTVKEKIWSSIGLSKYGLLVKWFNQDDSQADWTKISVEDKFKVLAQTELPGALSLAHTIELLVYPVEEVRRKAGRLVAKNIPPKYRNLVSIVPVFYKTISRKQAVMLISIFGYQGKDREKFVKSWFATNPDPNLVARLLLGTAGEKESDDLSFHAANYLADKDVQLNFEALKILVTHPEPLARALAYSKLDPSDPRERELLIRMADREKSKAIKKRIIEKLVTYSENRLGE